MSPEYLILFLLAALVHPLPAPAAERMPVTTVKPLLIAAIEHGEAHGVLTGESRAFMQRRFGSTAPIEIDVKAVRTLPQSGCKRLQVTTRQQGVMDANKVSTSKALVYEVSYCRDGRFPEAS